MTNPADRGDVRAGHNGTLGNSPPWRCPGPGSADSRGQRPRGPTGVARCASCHGGLAARCWKPEVLERAVGAKNCCGCCRRPDEGGCGGGTDRVPGRFPVQLVRDLALVERSYESTPCGAVGIFCVQVGRTFGLRMYQPCGSVSFGLTSWQH